MSELYEKSVITSGRTDVNHKAFNACTTVEEVEALQCHKCSTRTGHWGWCDAPFIQCKFKDKIKQILGRTESTVTLEDHIKMYELEELEK